MDEQRDAFRERIVALVSQWWEDHGTAMLLSRLGTEDGGEVAKEARRQAGSLAGYLTRLDDRVRLVRPTFDPLRCGVVPASVGDVDVDHLFEQTKASPAALQFQRAFWTAFRAPIEDQKRRFIRVEQPVRFMDLEGDGVAGWLEVPREYVAGAEDDNSLVQENAKRWLRDNELPERDYLQHGGANRRHCGNLLDRVLDALEPDDRRRITMPLDIIYKLRQQSQ